MISYFLLVFFMKVAINFSIELRKLTECRIMHRVQVNKYKKKNLDNASDLCKNNL